MVLAAGFEPAARPRLGKKSPRQFQDFVGPAQFLDFTRQVFDAVALVTGAREG
ncbi:MAG: hypothetical protein Q7T78_09120 [Rhodoferax sp.]|nr:hypothetical protein [Rhodoferax sp.]